MEHYFPQIRLLLYYIWHRHYDDILGMVVDYFRYGMTERACWNINEDFAWWALPRLYLYRENFRRRPAYPGAVMHDSEEWGHTLDEVIAAVELLKQDSTVDRVSDEQYQVMEKGLKKFGKYLPFLWT
jgi:hypothetical protein